MKRPVALLALIAIPVACERGTKGEGARSVSDTTDSVVSAPSNDSGAMTITVPLSPQLVCPATGLWSVCQVTYRLERGGLVPVRDSARVMEEPLQFPGVLLRLGRGELEVYLYESASSRERDQARLDRTKYVVYPAPMPMRPVPTLITSANLIAILHSRNDHLRERVSDALTAGPPQPSPIRP